MKNPAVIPFPSTTEANPVELSDLEQLFPRIAKQLTEIWNTSPIDKYLAGLLVNERDHRAGFPPDVALDIMMLDGVIWQLSEDRKRLFATKQNPIFSFGPKVG